MTLLKTTYEVVFRIGLSFTGGCDLLRSILVSWGYKESDIIEQSDKKFSHLSVYCFAPKDVLILKRRIKELHLKNIKVTSRTLRAKDWQNVWKKEFRPFNISPSIDIVPAWKKGKYRSKNGRVQIYIDTSVAFGTGMHATTQFMVQFIEKLKGKYRTVLDLGTGTGILAIAAEKMGAQKVKAVDISADAVRIAKENLKRNRSRCIHASCRDVKAIAGKEQFDLVAANLVTDDLIRLKKKIFSFVRPGGYLAVSGISQPNYKLLRSEYNDMPLKCIKTSRAKGWTAVLFRRNEKGVSL